MIRIMYFLKYAYTSIFVEEASYMVENSTLVKFWHLKVFADVGYLLHSSINVALA